MNNYPAMLYKNGDRDDESVIVDTPEEEKERRAEGYRSLRDKAAKSEKAPK